MAIAPANRPAIPPDPDDRVRSLFSSFATRPRAPASIAGLEQEFSVWLPGGPVDFRDLIGRVAPPTAVRRFAFDDNARVMPSGAIWTVDSPHAEIATPPRDLEVGIAGRLARDALTERAAMRRRLPTDAELRGYSTHLNAFAIDVDGWAIARRFATTYAPAIMLVAERRGSPGLLVRPRHQRLEIGTEFLETRADLVVAGLLVLSGTIAAWHACRLADGSPGDARLAAPAGPPAPAALDGRRLRHTWQRPGLFVARDAFGDDLYTHGRAARLRRADGSWEPAGDRLEAIWAHLRPIAERFGTAAELTLVDAVVAGDLPTPLEREAPQDPRIPRARRAPARRPADAAAALLATRRRGDLGLSPEYLTWDLAVLRVVHPARSFFLRVPRPAAQRLAQLWASGTLDEPLTAFATHPATGAIARLDEPSAGLFDVVEAPAAAATRMEVAKTATPPGSKPKRRMLPPPLLPPPAPPAPPLPPPVRPPGRRSLPWWPIVLIGLIVVLTTVLVGTGWPGRPLGSPAPSAGQPCATALVGQVASCPSSSPSVGFSPVPDCPPGLALAVGCPGQSPGLPSATPCPVGVVCQSPPPSTGPSPAATPCPVGAVCASPSPRPTTGPRPTPTPTPRPTPTPDRTGPTITRLSWTPGTIGAPLPAVGSCDPASGLGQSVNVSALVVDPSGVKSVVLLYQRERDAAPISVAMSLSGGRYRVTLTTATNAPAWQPVNLSYVVALSVRATDTKGNVRSTATVAGFSVMRC